MKTYLNVIPLSSLQFDLQPYISFPCVNKLLGRKSKKATEHTFSQSPTAYVTFFNEFVYYFNVEKKRNTIFHYTGVPA